MTHFVAVAADARIVVTGTTTGQDGGAEPESPEREATGQEKATGEGDPAGADANRACAGTDPVTRPGRSAGRCRRCRCWASTATGEANPCITEPRTGAWVADADRRQTVFVDSAGGHGLLDQAEGRAGVDAAAWPAAQDPTWRAGITHVTIDMSTV
jgi:hypothetical protein